jgi:hypothetical protein
VMWFYVSLKRALRFITQSSDCKLIHVQDPYTDLKRGNKIQVKESEVLHNFRYFVYLDKKCKYSILKDMLTIFV